MRYMDLHMHTDASDDCDAPIFSMCDAAVDKGLSAIAITDHVEMTNYVGFYDAILEKSWRTSAEAVERYRGKLRIARGIELGEPLADLETTAALLEAHPFDFILASQHQTPDDATDYYFYDYTGKDVEVVMDGYFDAVLRLAQWGGFHSLAHLTYPFRYIPPARRPAGYGRWQETIDATFRSLAEQGLALEINTSGLRQPGCGITHPDLPLVRRFRELGGERITIGADAHKPADVGANLADAAALAREAGFRYLTMYFHGEAEMVKIE